jgi:hypothetical protein
MKRTNPALLDPPAPLPSDTAPVCPPGQHREDLSLAREACRHGIWSDNRPGKRIRPPQSLGALD